MDSFVLNKYAMAFLTAVFVLMSASFISDSLFKSKVPDQAGFTIEGGVDENEPREAASAGAAYEPIATLLAGADLEAGAKVARKCAACHTFEKGGKKKVGPNLFNIIDKAMASNEGFAYSTSFKTFGGGKSWDYAAMNGFLFKPKKYVKGTSMGFAGLKKTKDRANIIAYIRSMADNPAPLPGE